MKVLIFAPYAGIWKHTILERQFIKSLSNISGVEVILVRCGGTFAKGCTVIRYFKLNESSPDKERQSICTICTSASQISDHRDLSIVENLFDYVSEQDLKEAAALSSSASVENALNTELNGMPLGRFALYEVILQFKKRNLKLNTEEILQYKTELENAILTARASKKVIDKFNPNLVLAFNPQYNSPGTFLDVAARMGIKTYYLSGSGSPREIATSMRIWDWEKYKCSDPALNFWKTAVVHKRVSGFRRRRAKAHFKYLAMSKSAWSYSSESTRKSPYSKFRIPKGQKLVLAVLNSIDEVFAADIRGVFPSSRCNSKVFENQQEWVRFLIDFYAKKPDYCLIIRVHPREFPNKRDQKTAEQANEWLTLLENLPANIKVDLPDEKFSIYDYFKHVEFITTGWSSVALESCYRGIPVVTYDRQLLGYPSDLVITGDSIQEYSSNLVMAEQFERNKLLRENVLKWIDFAFSDGAIRLGGGSRDFHVRSTNHGINLLGRLFNKVASKYFRGDTRRFDTYIPKRTVDDWKLKQLILQRRSDLYF